MRGASSAFYTNSKFIVTFFRVSIIGCIAIIAFDGTVSSSFRLAMNVMQTTMQ